MSKVSNGNVFGPFGPLPGQHRTKDAKPLRRWLLRRLRGRFWTVYNGNAQENEATGVGKRVGDGPRLAIQPEGAW